MTTAAILEAERRCEQAALAFAAADPESAGYLLLADELLRWSERLVRLREPIPASPPPSPRLGERLTPPTAPAAPQPPAGRPTASGGDPAQPRDLFSGRRR